MWNYSSRVSNSVLIAKCSLLNLILWHGYALFLLFTSYLFYITPEAISSMPETEQFYLLTQYSAQPVPQTPRFLHQVSHRYCKYTMSKRERPTIPINSFLLFYVWVCCYRHFSGQPNEKPGYYSSLLFLSVIISNEFPCSSDFAP